MSLPCHLVHDCALTEDGRLVFRPHLNASLYRFARVLWLGSWWVAVYGWILLCSPRNVAEGVGEQQVLDQKYRSRHPSHRHAGICSTSPQVSLT